MVRGVGFCGKRWILYAAVNGKVDEDRLLLRSCADGERKSSSYRGLCFGAQLNSTRGPKIGLVGFGGVMDVQVMLALAVLSLGCIAYVFWPQGRVAKPVEKTRLDYLKERKDVVYENLRDLNFEFRAGKYPEDDYARQRESLEAEAAQVVTEMQALGSYADGGS